jgi:hypothetical protein
MSYSEQGQPSVMSVSLLGFFGKRTAGSDGAQAWRRVSYTTNDTRRTL